MLSPQKYMGKWQVIPLAVADQQRHIDLSERLLTTAEPGRPAILYWSQAEREGLVLGYSQKHAILNSAALVAHQMPIYHRRAGGTAVLVGPQLLSLDVVLPANHPLILTDVVESYRWFGQAWMEALLLLGVRARVVSPEEAHEQHTWLKQGGKQAPEVILHRACYGSLSSYEVVVGQRKVVGFDMIRRRVGSLLQAGVLLGWQVETLAQLLGQTPDEQALLREGLCQRAVGLDSLTGRVVQAQEVIAAFERVIFAME